MQEGIIEAVFCNIDAGAKLASYGIDY